MVQLAQQHPTRQIVKLKPLVLAQTNSDEEKLETNELL